ncbi:hypothetical protein ABPG75_009067 [Micractinium tetrahymenae]
MAAAHSGGSSTGLSRRARIAVAVAVTVLVLSVTVAVVVAVTQANKAQLPPAASPPAAMPPSPPQVLPTPPPAPFPVPAGSMALWGDDFTGSKLNADIWAYDVGAPAGAVDAGQLQEYTDSSDNVQVQDGQLLITARKDGGSYTSGRVRSKQGVYPGMQALQLPGGGAAASVHVEASIQIDVMELIDGMTNVTSGLHYGNQYPQNTVADVSVQQPSGQPFSNGQHVYALDWERDAITISVDGAVSRRYVSRRLDPQNGWFTGAAGALPEAPFDAPFNVIL